MVDTEAAKGGSKGEDMEPSMMVNRDMTPADVAAVTGNNNNDDCWGGGAWWIVVLFLFAFCGGWGNRGNGEQPVTEAGLCNAMNFSDLENAVGRLNDSNVNQFQQLGAAVANANTQNALGQANLTNQIQTTACETQRAIDGVNYNLSQSAACINANTTEQTQKVLDAITGNRMADMQSQINQLQLNEALCGVVRYPNATTYNAGANPYFAGNGCGCGTAF